MEDLMQALDVVRTKRERVEELQRELREASEDHQQAVAAALALHDKFQEHVASLLPADARKRG